MAKNHCLTAIAFLVFLSIAGCAFNQPQKGNATVNVAAVLSPGGGASPAILALYKAALEISKAGNGEFDLKLVTITPQIQSMKPAQPTEDPPSVTALQQALGQDPPPDVILFNSAVEFTTAVEKELLLDVDQYVRGDKAMPKEDYFPGALEAVSDSGRLFGLPVSGGPTVMQYDKRLFDAAGLGPPPANWTWSQFLDIARRLTKATGDPQTDQYALNLVMGGTSLPPFIWQNGGELISKDGRRTLIGEPSSLEAIKFYDDLTTSYKVSAPPFNKSAAMIAKPMTMVRGGPGESPPLMSPSGRVAMNFVGDAGVFYGPMFGQGDDRALRFAELPRGKVPATILSLHTVVAVTAKARNPRLAYKVAATLVSEMQKEVGVPARRSAAKNLRRINANVAEDDAQVIVNSMEYARPMPLNGHQRFMRPYYEKLVSPLQSGSKKLEEAVKDAVDALDQALNE